MKKSISSPSISAVLILIGVLVNGFVGNTLEMIAHLIDTFKGKSSTKLFLQKLFIIGFTQITINWVFADNSMTVDMTLWLVEKGYKILWTEVQMWVAVSNLLALVRIVGFRKELKSIRIFLFKNQSQNNSITSFTSAGFVNFNCS